VTQNTPLFACRNVHVRVEGKEIVRGVDLEIFPGECHVLMGPNGSGKSTFVTALMGHPAYEVAGEILLDGVPVGELAPDERARRGMFLGFQHPIAVPGVSVANFLRAALGALRGAEVDVKVFRRELKAAFAALGVPADFAGRYLNDGFSGGEKKRLEILQLSLLRPRFALLDEIDSGLDIDALKIVAQGINDVRVADTGMLMVTHYQRILNYVKPDRVHVLAEGRIVRSGGPEVARDLEEHGYEGKQPAVA
jgi:Fe-S cluster assembly ATP-binding protein